jgi:hypothetical protein
MMVPRTFVSMRIAIRDDIAEAVAAKAHRRLDFDFCNRKVEGNMKDQETYFASKIE